MEQALAAMKLAWPAAYAATTKPTPSVQIAVRAGSADVVRVVSVARGISQLRERYKRSLTALAVLAVLLWALACLNISGVFLTRSVTRETEFRIQIALGAGRGRLIAKLVAEGLVVAVTAAALALVLTWTLSAFLLHSVWTNSLPSTLDVTPDATAILVALGVALATMAVVSAPSIVMVAMRQWTVLTGWVRRRRASPPSGWRAILTAQVSASVVLLFVAGVMTQNLTHLLAIDPGYDRDHVLFARLDPRPGVAAADNPSAYLQALLERTQGLAGVQATAFSLSFPTAEVRHVEALTPAYRADTNAPGSEITAATDWVSPGFFVASGMRLASGRDLTWQDSVGQPEVAVATARMAQMLFANAVPARPRRAAADGQTGNPGRSRRGCDER